MIEQLYRYIMPKRERIGLKWDGKGLARIESEKEINWSSYARTLSHQNDGLTLSLRNYVVSRKLICVNIDILKISVWMKVVVAFLAVRE